jgi:hypothetical protein
MLVHEPFCVFLFFILFFYIFPLGRTFLCLSLMKHTFAHNSLICEFYQRFVSYYVLLWIRGSCSCWSTGYFVAFLHVFPFGEIFLSLSFMKRTITK